eukprot:jgi/Chrzof1/5134/Cz15g12200.t1
METRRKVTYFYDEDVGDYYYSPSHPMKPHRVRMTHDLICRYGLYSLLDVYRPIPAQLEHLAAFHSPEYLAFLQSADSYGPQNLVLKTRFNFKEDCPVFDGMFEYCQKYAGASIGAAVQLNYKQSDLVINWSGGLHHAKKAEASGFCYVNDIVLAILELLKYHSRVVYIDIDIHHGDGVEEAFTHTDRVLTVSFHKYDGEFFPGTGSLHDVGIGKGKYYSVNVPLNDGMDDPSFEYIFAPIMDKIMERYQPEAVVLQSGADSLSGDRLGSFNLSIKGHASCHRHMLKYGVPMIVLGGGGYKIKSVARCWTYETAVLLGKDGDLSDDLPPHEYYDLFKLDNQLHIPTDPDLENENPRHYLDQVVAAVLQNVQQHIHPVSVEFGSSSPQSAQQLSRQLLSPGQAHVARAMSDAHQLWQKDIREESDSV